MYKRNKTKWTSQDKKLQSLYGLDLDMSVYEPKFGPQLFPLSVWTPKCDNENAETKRSKRRIEVANAGAGISEKLLPPTLSNLSWHFGYLFWYTEATLAMDRETNGKITSSTLDRRFLESAREKAVRSFEREIVSPLRRALFDIELLLYCVPSIERCVNQITGEIEIKDGELSLQLLPATVRCAKHYGFDDNEILLLSPTILRIIKNMCGWGTIKTQKQLEKFVDLWYQLADPKTTKAFQEIMEEEHSHLLYSRSFSVL